MLVFIFKKNREKLKILGKLWTYKFLFDRQI